MSVNRIHRAGWLCGVAVCLAGASLLHAKPAYKRQVVAHYGEYLPRAVADCAICHLTDEQVEARKDAIDPLDEKPWNAFGQSLKALGATQRKETGRRAPIVERIKALARQDADGDGAANELELLAGTWPAVRESKPDGSQLAAARRARELLKNRYEWKPFEPVPRPAAPHVKNDKWVRNPIDAFIAAQHEARGLAPQPEARREVLLRRVHLDLIGLPPTRDELRAFLVDKSDDAYEKVVGRLLDSPQYGQRWARHWMDIWRYADQDQNRLSGGVEIAPNMWRWRDWIVESLNADTGYDTMLRHMLAGDEIAPTDIGVLRATAYLARNKARSRDEWLHETVDHAMQAFAGLTIQCARCHDHPVEEITQKEYYELRAIFEPYNVRSDPLPDADDKKKDTLTYARDENLNAATHLYRRGNVLDPDKEHPLGPGVPALVSAAAFDVEPLELATDAGTRRSSGRRLALVKWLTHRDQPLTARVAANHIWARHFGTGIVASVNDFGTGGASPTHPALLDWLAAELMDRDWRMKHLHRLIVTSSTYRMASTPPADNPSADPDNRFLWRFAPRRMEAELVRDSILYVTGRLDDTLGGPPLDTDRADAELRRSLYFQTSPYTQMQFLVTFDGAAVQECYERTESVQPHQALALLNSRIALESARLLARKIHSRIEGGEDASVGAFADVAFETVLSRSPTDKERDICVQYLRNQTDLLTNHKDAKRDTTTNASDGTKPSADPALRACEGLVHLLINHHEFVTIR